MVVVGPAESQGILAAEFVWARRLLDRLKEQGVRIRDTVMPREKPDNV